jgi:hypothetical protein
MPEVKPLAMPETRTEEQSWAAKAVPSQSVKQATAKSFATCSFPLALAIFLGINLVSGFTRPLKPLSPEELPFKATWECQRAKRFIDDSQGQAPQTVLFGSSLMMIPTTCAEADYKKTLIDPVVDPYSSRLASLLSSPENKTQRAFNYALPGAMVSDHYFIERALFNQRRKPERVVLGVTLRDFIDCGVDTPTATPAYMHYRNYLSEEALDEVLQKNLNLWQKRNYLAERYLYLWGRHNEIQKLANKPLQATYDNLVSRFGIDNKGTKGTEGSKALASDKDSTTSGEETQKGGDKVDAIMAAQEVKPGNFVILPEMKLPWQDNTREYKKRFAHKNEAVFKSEQAFLDDLLAYNSSLGIETIIVNMPLTESNMKLMPKGSYDKYKAMLVALKNRGVSVLDLNDSSFDLSCFRDTVHMNGRGGAKLLAAIASHINTNQAELAGHKNQYQKTN